jgi:putative transposase
LTVAKPRRVQQDGIHFQGLRYLDLTLAAYVGEWVLIRYDPADLAEIRVYHQERFLCRAVCQELASATIDVQEIVQARNARRRELRAGLRARERVVEQVLGRRDPVPIPEEVPAPPPTTVSSPLKRYWNE